MVYHWYYCPCYCYWLCGKQYPVLLMMLMMSMMSVAGRLMMMKGRRMKMWLPLLLLPH